MRLTRQVGFALLRQLGYDAFQGVDVDGLGDMGVHAAGEGLALVLGEGVGRHGNNGHLRGIGSGQRTDGRGARFCILSVYNFKSLAVGMAVW